MVRLTPSLIAIFSIILTAALGCGGSGSIAGPDSGSDAGKIAEFVDYFNDYVADAAKFKKAFAGKAPSSRKEYELLRFEVKAGSLKVDGTNATATVDIRNDSSHEVIATKEWTFTKVGEEWKLKDAPLR